MALTTSRHAVMIMAHADWSGLRRLVGAIDHERVDIFIHINSRSTDWKESLLDGACTHSRIFFVHREKVSYCNYSQVKAMLSLLKAATAYEPYCHYHIISGADLPLRSMDEILSFFDSHSHTEFVGFSTNYDCSKSGFYFPLNNAIRTTRGFIRKLLIKMQKFAIILQRALGVNLANGYGGRPFKGCDWWSITHDGAVAVLEGEAKFYRYFRHTYCPSELLVQTILGNDVRFKDKFYNLTDEVSGAMRLIDWQRGTPYVWRNADFEYLINSPCMFARKFDSTVDQEIIKKIINHIKQQ